VRQELIHPITVVPKSFMGFRSCLCRSVRWRLYPGDSFQFY